MSDELPKILLHSLKLEYEQTPISLEDLCTKHKLKMEQLPSNWAKAYEGTPNSSLVLPGTLLPSEEDEDTEDNPDNKEESEIRTSLNKTAKTLIKEVQSMLTSSDLTPRDLKDIASTLISIKDSVLGKDPTVKIDVTNNTQINLLTNIVKEIKGAQRDC